MPEQNPNATYLPPFGRYDVVIRNGNLDAIVGLEGQYLNFTDALRDRLLIVLPLLEWYAQWMDDGGAMVRLYFLAPEDYDALERDANGWRKVDVSDLG